MDSPSRNLKAWCGEIAQPFEATAVHRSEQMHPASASITNSERHAEVSVVGDGFMESTHGMR